MSNFFKPCKLYERWIMHKINQIFSFLKKICKTPLQFLRVCVIVLKTLGGPLWPNGRV